MFRIYIILGFLMLAGAGLQAQHFDELYNSEPQKGPEKTWRDSGYYFVPTLVRFEVFSLAAGPNGSGAAEVVFRSTDNSGLTFSGQASFLFRPNNLPAGTNIAVETRGLALVLLPMDLLYCPDDEQEQGMGQDDPYFPLSLVGQFERISGDWLDPPSLILVQLNDFVVN
jgi:hypothetical protein